MSTELPHRVLKILGAKGWVKPKDGGIPNTRVDGDEERGNVHEGRRGVMGRRMPDLR